MSACIQLTAKDDRNHEQAAGEVAPEAEEPVQQHLPDRDATVQERETSKQIGSSEQLSTGKPETKGGDAVST